MNPIGADANRGDRKEEMRRETSTHQHAETADVGEGSRHGGTGEIELAEVADEHDGDELKAVLEEARSD